MVAMVMGLGTAVQADANCSNCAVQQPDQPAIPQTPEDGTGCSNCAIPVPVPQKLADSCTNCAIEQPGDEPTPTPQRADRSIIVADASCNGC
jgi:hypothetical protein